MQLAGHTYAFRSLPLERALERLVGLGLHDVEVWLGHAREDPDKAAEIVERAGVQVRAISAGGFYAIGDDTPARAVALAAALDVHVIVMCVAPELVASLERLIPPQVWMAVENHWDQPLARSPEVAAAIGTSRLVACLDTGHALAAGEMPEDFARRLGRRLAHVHLKEGRMPSRRERLLGRRVRRRVLGKLEPVVPGKGDLDLPALRAALTEIGFDGCVTAEHEGEQPEKALATLARRWQESL